MICKSCKHQINGYLKNPFGAVDFENILNIFEVPECNLKLKPINNKCNLYLDAKITNKPNRN